MTEDTKMKNFELILYAINGVRFNLIKAGIDSHDVKKSLLEVLNRDKFVEVEDRLVNTNNIIHIEIKEKAEEVYTEPEEGKPW